MATVWAHEGAVLDQIEDTITDGVQTARARLPMGEGAEHCVECGEDIPEARRKALPGATTCVACQARRDSRIVLVGINRLESKDIQLRWRPTVSRRLGQSIIRDKAWWGREVWRSGVQTRGFYIGSQGIVSPSSTARPSPTPPQSPPSRYAPSWRGHKRRGRHPGSVPRSPCPLALRRSAGGDRAAPGRRGSLQEQYGNFHGGEMRPGSPTACRPGAAERRRRRGP